MFTACSAMLFIPSVPHLFFFAPERFQAHHIQLKFMNHLLPVPPRKDLKPYSAFVDTSTRKKSQQSSEKIEDLRTSKTTHSRCLWCSEAGDLSSVWRSIKAHVSGCLRPDIFLVNLPGKTCLKQCDTYLQNCRNSHFPQFPAGIILHNSAVGAKWRRRATSCATIPHK